MQLISLVQKIDNNLIPFYPYCYNTRFKQIKTIFVDFIYNKNFKQILNILKLIYINFFTPIAFIIGLLFLIFRIKILLIDLSQIGSILWLDLFEKENRKNKKFKIIIIKQKIYPLANNLLITLYGEYFFFIKSFLLRFLLLPLTNIKFICINTNRFEIDNRCAYAHTIWDKEDNKNKIAHFKSYLDSLENNNKIFKSNKIFEKKFVTIHVRDPGFYNDVSRQTRNADINTYLDLIIKLQKEGFAVIKLGDKNSIPLKENFRLDKSMYFDYALSKYKSELNDILIISNAEFHIGTPSGLSLIPMIFDKNTYWTNMNTVTQSLGFKKGDITIFKKIIKIKNQKLLNLNNYLEFPFDQNNQIKDLQKIGYSMINNSAEEISECFKDFYNIYNNNRNKKNISNQIKMKLNNYSFHAKGGFSNIFIEKFYKI